MSTRQLPRRESLRFAKDHSWQNFQKLLYLGTRAKVQKQEPETYSVPLVFQKWRKRKEETEADTERYMETTTAGEEGRKKKKKKKNRAERISAKSLRLSWTVWRNRSEPCSQVTPQALKPSTSTVVPGRFHRSSALGTWSPKPCLKQLALLVVQIFDMYALISWGHPTS